MRKFLDWDNISDDEIRIIGDRKSTKPQRRRWVIVPISVLIIGLIVLIPFLINDNKSAQQVDYIQQPCSIMRNQCVDTKTNCCAPGFCEIVDTAVNNKPLRIYIPHNAQVTLHKGELDKRDSTIIYVSMAAEVRADNGGILGSFVLRGEPLAWGLSRKGYCAIIYDSITVGVADNSPLFERATETEGYFFRQYPLVDNGVIATEKTNAYNYLRALCQKDGKTFMVHSLAKVSFPEFAQMLIDLGCDNAIYIVGYKAYGWAIDEEDVRYEFGTEGYFDDKVPTCDNFNYIVWRRE